MEKRLVDLPLCTVVVCTRDRPRELSRCLEALSAVAYPRFEVCVVHNAPTETETRRVAERFGARYLVEPVPGLSRARNRGAQASAGEVVAYIDDDAVPEPGWLEAITREFEDPRVMMVAGRVLPLSAAAGRDRVGHPLGGPVHAGTRLVVDRATSYWFELANFGAIGIGANMAVRRSAFEVWPGFDVRLGRGACIWGGEEVHAFFSLVERGYHVVRAPAAVVRHRGGGTPEELRAAHLRRLRAVSAYVVFLFAEYPCYRGRLVRYVLRGVAAAPRPWRESGAPPAGKLVPRWREVLAWLSGPWLYARSRMAS